MERTVTIASGHGLHARPAKLFTQAVAASGHQVTIARPGGKAVNAASILGIIAEGFENGDKELSFELWNSNGRFLFVGPRIAEGGMYKLDELHVLARIDGVIRMMNQDGTQSYVPKLRIIALHDNDALLVQGK